MNRIRVQAEDFDAGVELDRLIAAGVGAIASFIGIVRGNDGLTALHLEHYPAMTIAMFDSLARTASERWPLSAVTIIHRVGTLVPGDRIVFVAAASSHRGAALDACAFLIDMLKTKAPFWKQERFHNAPSIWVESRPADLDTASRWD
jgi:molybdopterin synthase catalytic subunit